MKETKQIQHPEFEALGFRRWGEYDWVKVFLVGGLKRFRQQSCNLRYDVSRKIYIVIIPDRHDEIWDLHYTGKIPTIDFLKEVLLNMGIKPCFLCRESKILSDQPNPYLPTYPEQQGPEAQSAASQ